MQFAKFFSGSGNSNWNVGNKDSRMEAPYKYLLDERLLSDLAHLKKKKILRYRLYSLHACYHR